MQLLSDDKLVWSATVANSRMNRSRNSSGINSYEKDINLKPETFLQQIIDQKGYASWLDLCCGEGKALLQVFQFFNQKNLSKNIKLVGVDLVGNMQHESVTVNDIVIHTIPFSNFNTDEKFDLVTCVHGLHYIGDKLKAIEKAISLLSDTGVFIANLDICDLAIPDFDSRDFFESLFKKNSFEYNLRQRLLKKSGYSIINFGCDYLGADDDHGKNYTGQESVKSFYSVER